MRSLLAILRVAGCQWPWMAAGILLGVVLDMGLHGRVDGAATVDRIDVAPRSLPVVGDCACAHRGHPRSRNDAAVLQDSQDRCVLIDRQVCGQPAGPRLFTKACQRR